MMSILAVSAGFESHRRHNFKWLGQHDLDASADHRELWDLFLHPSASAVDIHDEIENATLYWSSGVGRTPAS
jgi:hypothetical protein